MKKTILFLLITISFIGVSCQKKQDKKSHEVAAIKVKTHKVEASKTINSVSASGTVEAQNSANLSTRMMGFVSEINAKVGQKVTKGQLLLSVNSTDLQAKKAQVDAQIQQAQAGYDNAKKDYERFKDLYAKQSASQKELENMTTRYEMAKAGLETAQQMKNEVLAQFSYADIRAPFSGVVTNTFVKVGDMANPGMPLLTVEGERMLQVMAMVGEQDIVKITEGAHASVVIKSIQEQVQGKVIEVSQSAKNTGGQYVVKIGLEKPSDKVLPGMFANVDFEVEEKESHATGQVWIGAKLLVSKGQLKGIYVIGDTNKALLRWLRLGKQSGGMIEVLSGLQVGETYITTAEGKLFDGVPVQVQ